MEKLFHIIVILLFSFQVRILHGQNIKSSKGESLNTVYINVDKPDASPGDTFILFRYKRVLSKSINRHLPRDTFYGVMGADHKFHFEIPDVKDIDYIRLGREKDDRTHQLIDILSYYMVAPGDSITVHIAWDSSYHAEDHLVHVLFPDSMIHDIPLIQQSPRFKFYLQYHLSFSGRGIVKYQCNRALDSIRTKTSPSRDPELKALTSYRSKLKAPFYNIFKANIIGYDEEVLYEANLHARKGSGRWNKARNYFDSVSDNPAIPVKAKILSRFYPRGLLVRSYAKYLPRKEHYKEIYNDIINRYKGGLRDKVLAILARKEYIPDSTRVFQDAMNRITDPYYKAMVSQVISGEAKGLPAYDFSLPDSSGRMVNLSDFRGKVVFVDFWFTGCGACEAFYQKQLAKVERAFCGSEDVVFISISIDGSRRMWLRSVRTGTYSSEEHAVNLYTNGKYDRHPVIARYHIMGYPQTFLIDQKGRFVNYALRNASEISTEIRKLLE